MKIICLSENLTYRPSLRAEHGLSLYLETSSHRILFDMGQSDAFAANAAVLGIDLGKVDLAILSHGHYDHGGGLGCFLSLNDHAPVYLTPTATEPHYGGGGARYNGLAPSLCSHPRLIRVEGERTALAPGLTLHSGAFLPDRFGFSGEGLMAMKDGKMVPDRFEHEQYLLVEEAGRRILISGCSHRGIANLVAHFAPDVLIGGFHFMKRPVDESLLASGRALGAQNVEYYTCHCTGIDRYAALKAVMPRLHYLACGDEVTV